MMSSEQREMVICYTTRYNCPVKKLNLEQIATQGFFKFYVVHILSLHIISKISRNLTTGKLLISVINVSTRQIINSSNYPKKFDVDYCIIYVICIDYFL